MSDKRKLLGELLEPLNFFTESFEERQTHIINLLCRDLNTKTVVAFIGAGASQPLGYPGWTDFARDIVLILRLIFEKNKLYKSIAELPDENTINRKQQISTISEKYSKKLKDEIFKSLSDYEIEKREIEANKTGKNLTDDEKEEIKSETIEKKLEGYSPIINTVKELHDKIDDARVNYYKLRRKHKKKYFDDYLKYIDKTQENEINALYIFSECERILSDKDDWKEKKQSEIFRKIVEAYFQEKYKKVKERLIEKHIEDNATYVKLKTEVNALLKNEAKASEDIKRGVSNSADANCVEKKNTLENKKKQLEYLRISLKKELEKQQLPEEILEKYNPYIALSGLPIRKFITPNYDLEIERALLYQKKIIPTEESRKELKKDYASEKVYESEEYNTKDIITVVGEKSFSQIKENHKQLADFSVARYDEKNYSVFHCHGRIDDFDSCVVSEEDYQKWYLKEEPQEYTPFRQTIDIILNSNPILFMGFGLKDADFMRLLRQITANRPLNKTRTPLFCLLYVGEDDVKPENGADGKKNYKWQSDKELEEECTALYIKYGLHIIPVKVKEMKAELRDKYGNGDATCIKLLELRDKWLDWQKGIRKKPKFRKTFLELDSKNDDGKQYFHYEFVIDANNKIKTVDDRLMDDLKNVLEEEPWSERTKKGSTTGFFNQILSVINEKQVTKNSSSDVEFANRLAVVVGDGGTGKSWAVQEYLKKADYKDFKKFFWSAYYSNDVMTGIDRLIEYFISDQEIIKKERKFDLLKKIIDNEEKEKRIIVFDGIEKMLIANRENTEGISVSPEIKEFFKIISHYKNTETRIILTSRIFPTDILYHFDSRIEREEKGDTKKELEDKKLRVKTENVIRAPKCWRGDLLPSTVKESKPNKSKDIKEFSIIEKADEGKGKTSAICSLVEGHIFGISLIRGILKDARIKRIEKYKEFRSKRGKEKFEFNFSKDDIEKVNHLIQNLANTPIDKRIQRVIEEAIQNLNKSEKYKEKGKIIEEFIQRIALFMHPVREEIAKVCLDDIKEKEDIEIAHLLEDLSEKSIIQKVKTNSEKESVEYVVHPLIRSYVFERIHKSLNSSLPSLQLPGFSSGKETVDPGADNGQKIAKNLFNKLCDKSKKETDQKIACDMCRAAFSILRSRFCSNTVARWGSYEDYVKLVVNLYDTSKTVAKELWDYNEPTHDAIIDCENEETSLYPDELAWVYNEIGLASQSMGNNMNALALWEQGYEINKLIDRYNEDGRYIFQSNFNLGAINLYYGKLRVAQEHLDKAFEIANRLENINLSNRVLGYRALLKYLQGNLEEAENDFKAACAGLESNPRARALFYYFYGELLMKKGDWNEAEKKIEESRNLARAKYYPDLILYARLTKANLLRKKNLYPESQYEYQYVLGEAKSKRLFRLEASVLSGMSRLSEELGDYQSATGRAVESLKIANEYSLGLQQTVSLLVLGKALIKNNLRELGISCLITSRELAKSQSYFLRLNEIESELRKYNHL